MKKHKANKSILALGAESAGNFSVFYDTQIYHSDNFGDLLDEKNFDNFKKAILDFLKKEKIKPDIIITDLHPLYVTTIWGEKLAKKLKAEHIQVQHHIAHVFSQFESQGTRNKEQGTSKISNAAYGIALDGTGYGMDGKIWGGECFAISNSQFPNPNDKIYKPGIKIERIGYLENQILIGGDLAIKEPARVLISILSKFLSKKEVFNQVKKYYSKNQFELLWNQLQQNFNCQETSSTGRILDAVSVLLGIANNERKEKHGATYLLEKNSTEPYLDLKPKIKKAKTPSLEKGDLGGFEKHILETTLLFEYLIKNIHKDNKRLAATAQLYIAQGLYKIIKKHSENPKVILSGGLSENKIIKEYFESKNILQNKNPATPYGDAGLSVGQINYFSKIQ